MFDFFHYQTSEAWIFAERVAIISGTRIAFSELMAMAIGTTHLSEVRSISDGEIVPSASARAANHSPEHRDFEIKFVVLFNYQAGIRYTSLCCRPKVHRRFGHKFSRGDSCDCQLFQQFCCFLWVIIRLFQNSPNQ